MLSGKGGTGKTLVAVNLAFAAGPSVYVDCDVEGPNGRLFFKPSVSRTQSVSVKIPVVDETRCVGCRKCVDFCQYNALAFIKNKPLLFEEVCHSCGGCVLLCPETALSEKERVIGTVQDGRSGQVFVKTGILNEGEVSGIPIIRELLSELPDQKDPVFIDCPPGSACSVMECIRDAGFCVLVAEPTVFGAQNLSMVVELVRLFNKPFGVVLNKCLDGVNPSEEFCLNEGVEILGRIPFDSELGTISSNAEIAAGRSEKYREIFSNLLDTVLKEALNETASHRQR